MKLLKFFASVMLAAACFTACTQRPTLTQFRESSERASERSKYLEFRIQNLAERVYELEMCKTSCSEDRRNEKIQLKIRARGYEALTHEELVWILKSRVAADSIAELTRKGTP